MDEQAQALTAALLLWLAVSGLLLALYLLVVADAPRVRRRWRRRR